MRLPVFERWLDEFSLSQFFDKIAHFLRQFLVRDRVEAGAYVLAQAADGTRLCAV
jgi:hypothetical protein